MEFFGEKGDPHEICNAFGGQDVLIHAPALIPPQLSPAELVVPSRFYEYCIISFLSSFFFGFFFAMGKGPRGGGRF